MDLVSVLPTRISHFAPADLKKLAPVRTSCLRQVVDTMGRLSAEAQTLPTIITTYAKFAASDDQHLYLLRSPSKGEDTPRVLGLLKVGTKDLFFHDELGQLSQKLRPLCVLDFYIHESQQRRGLGLELLNHVLQDIPSRCSSPSSPPSSHRSSNSIPLQASQLAFDRPSAKLLAFLARHFGLHDPILQNNNFVVFKNFFHSNPVPMASDRNSRSNSCKAKEDQKPKHFAYAPPNKTINNNSIASLFTNNNFPSDKETFLPSFGIDRSSKAKCSGLNKMAPLYSRHDYDTITKKTQPLQQRQQRQQPKTSLAHTWHGNSVESQSKTQQQRVPSLRAPFACQVQDEVETEWRSGTNKRFQRTALW